MKKKSKTLNAVDRMVTRCAQLLGRKGGIASASIRAKRKKSKRRNRKK